MTRKFVNNKFSSIPPHYRYDIYHDKELIGFVLILEKSKYIENIEISSEFRRKGIASYIYDYIEDDLGILLEPSKNQFTDGKLFWKNRFKTKWFNN